MSEAPAPLKIAILIPDDRYRAMITPSVDEQLNALGVVARASGNRAAVTEHAPALLPTAHVLVTGWGSPQLSEAMLDEATELRMVLHCAGSVRGIVPKSIFDRGIALSHAAPIIADAVAEFCLLQELLWLRGVHRMDAALKAGIPWRDAGHYPAQLLNGRLVGIVGSGYVAQRHIRLLHAFGARIRVADPYLTDERASELDVERISLDDIFGQSEIISIHAPKTAETHHMIGVRQLALIRPGTILIQTSRSWVMDQGALLAELQTRRFVASIDVFDEEPERPDSPFFALDNVVVTPHRAGHTLDTAQRQGAAMAEELTRFVRGEPLQYQVRPELYDQMA